MAEHAYAELKVNDEAVAGKVEGRLETRSLVEVLFLDHGCRVPQSEGGRRQMQPITFRTWHDPSTVKFIRALANGEKVEGTFEFYQAPEGGGTKQEKYMTIQITNGRVIEVSGYKPQSAGGKNPDVVDISIAFETIKYRHEKGGTECHDTWKKEG